MFLGKIRKRRIMILTEERYLDLENYISTHFEFLCNDKYTGLTGIFRAIRDMRKAAVNERLHSGEYYYEPPVEHYSDPAAKRLFQGEREREKQRFITEEAFSTALINLIAEKGRDHISVYKNANIDRRLFSKIISNPEYFPSKKTILALAISLELNFEETQELLKRAGFTLSRSILFDVIVEYFITQGIHDLYEVNKALIAYGYQPLGSY